MDLMASDLQRNILNRQKAAELLGQPESFKDVVIWLIRPEVGLCWIHHFSPLIHAQIRSMIVAMP